MKEQDEGQITNLVSRLNKIEEIVQQGDNAISQLLGRLTTVEQLTVTKHDKERAEDVLLNAKGNDNDIVLNFMELSRIKQNEKQLINSIRSEMKEINFQ